MSELNALMGEVPASILDPTAPAGTDDDDQHLDDDAPDDLNDDQTGQGDDNDDDTGEDDEAAAGSKKKEEEDDDDDNVDYFTDGSDEDEDEEKPAAATAPVVTPPEAPAAALTDEGQYILTNLSKIAVNLIMPTADGKGQEVKEFQVYGWGDLPKNMLGFQSAYEQGTFTASANNNELKARELQQDFRAKKVQQDAEAYTLRENRAIARDLKDLRKDGVFPKFKGIPGTDEFNGSEGAKEFDRVVAFMNEENDKAGQAAQKGDAFYHISFKQAYRMLHPEKFDTKKQQQQRQSDHSAARRIKGGGGGSNPKKNPQSRRVANITDLADEFAQFAGSSS